MISISCDNCKIRIPKNRPLLVCSLCSEYKHYKCNNLSKNDAYDIITSGNLQNWACQSCTRAVFPIGLLSDVNKPFSTDTDNIFEKHGPTCNVCNKKCGRSNKLKSCCWCDSLCHNKCMKNSLGCINCCKDMIPGFFYYMYELNNDSRFKNSSIFNPYDHNSMINQIGNHFDFEDGHEMHFANEISEKLHNCKYTEYKDMKVSNQNELKIMSLNIRSLKNGITDLRENISFFSKFDVLCFNETNCDLSTLPNGIDDLLLDGFYPPRLQKPYRQSNKGGGLAFYVNHRACDDTNYEILELNLEHVNEHSCEHMFLKINIKLTNNSLKSYIIGNLYRSPDSKIKLTDFTNRIEQMLAKLDKHKTKNITLVGDLNIDLIKHDTDKHGQELINMTTSHGFLQVISRPTRITDHTATLIDHIYTNKIQDVYSCGVIACDISDHLVTYVNIALCEKLNHNTTNFSKGYSKFTEANTQKFRDLLNDETWQSVLDEPSAQSKYTKFIEIYTHHYNAAFPKVSTSKKRRKNVKPWILPWLEDACNRKNKLYYTYIRDPSPENKIKYEKMKKFVKKHIQLAKKKFYNKYFENHNSNSKKQWRMINSLLNRHVRRSEKLKLKDANGNIISSPLHVAENFNNFFAGIAKKLKHGSGLNSPEGSPLDSVSSYLNDPVAKSISLKPTNPIEIKNIITNLKLKSTSDTKICALKTATEINSFNSVVTDIINSSFVSGIFPSELKIAKVVPIHKGGSKSEVSNYRPISLLSSFSKIFEKAMYARLINFLNSNKTLTESQYGFRAGRSCEHALLDAQK